MKSLIFAVFLAFPVFRLNLLTPLIKKLYVFIKVKVLLNKQAFCNEIRYFARPLFKQKNKTLPGAERIFLIKSKVLLNKQAFCKEFRYFARPLLTN